MHIALYAPAWPPNEAPNGIVIYVHNMRSELLRQGHQVSVFCRRIGSSNRDSHIHLIKPNLRDRILDRVKKFAATGADYVSWGNYIGEAIHGVHRTDPIDIVEMEEFWGWCATVQEWLPFPVVVKLHGPGFLTSVGEESGTRKARVRIELEGRALAKMRTIIAPSRTTLAATVSRYHLSPQIQKVVPNPLIVESDERWSLDSCDRKAILFVGRFDALKGGDIALIAFRKLLDVDPKLQLIFVGPDHGLEASKGHRVRFAEFRDALFARSLRSNIRYLGQLPRAQIFKLRTKAMVNIVVSRWENQPNTALEAMIQGCPVVALNTGGISEIVEHERTGLLAQPDKIDDLCGQIMRLVQDPAFASRLGDNARQTIIERHSVDKIVQQTLDVYRSSIALHASLHAT